jgi:UDPglucose 6-dehydrogenase
MDSVPDNFFEKMIMKIAVIGTGYVGLVSGACFSHFGFDVICVDQHADKIAILESGEIPIYEPGLAKVVSESKRKGRLKFTTDLSAALSQANAVFIVVGTPTDDKTGRADLTYVLQAGEQIAKLISDYTVVIIKSTVPVGTADTLRKVMIAANPLADFDVVSNPEFLREGSAVEDFLHPDRVVIGVASAKAEAVMRKLYQPLSANDVPLVITSSASAELIKYTSNCYLALRIGFINQVTDLCEASGADIREVALGSGLDKRIGLHYFAPGPGFGGSCFPKDTRALAAIGRDLKAPISIIEEVVEANEKRRAGIASRVAKVLGGQMAGKKVAVLGIAFKAETDDIRDAAALAVVPALQAMGAEISAYDPAAMEHGRKAFQNVSWCDDLYRAANAADLVLVLTEWNEFRGLDFAQLKSVMRQPVILDYRNLYIPQDVAKAGFEYHSLGRATQYPM